MFQSDDYRRLRSFRPWYLASVGLAAVISCSVPSEGTAPSVAQAATVGGGPLWAAWTNTAKPVFEGSYTASDPTLLRDGTRLMMVATDLDVATNRTLLVAATSVDGLSWSFAGTPVPQPGTILQGRAGKWDENLETAELVRSGTGYLLYYSGYRTNGFPAPGFPAAMGLATSQDGRNFVRVSDAPTLQPTPGWYDNDATYSPTVLRDGTGFVMLYVGHAYTRTDKIGGAAGVYLLGATSSDGRLWTKRASPVISPGGGLPWMRDGAAEPSLVKGPDGAYYLFFTGLAGEARVIGVARGTSPFGPWEINPTPIVAPSSGQFDESVVLGPYVIIEAGKARMWFLGADRTERIRIGYEEAAWPIYNPAATLPFAVR